MLSTSQIQVTLNSLLNNGDPIIVTVVVFKEFLFEI